MENVKYEDLHRGKLKDPLLYHGDDDTPFTGIATSWYKNGQVKFECQYKAGVLNGTFTWYHRNGEIEHKAVYVNGKLEQFCSDSELNSE
jgi:antitoxin component YwqK of YwqJK toxin-antitoxin module